MRSFAQFLAEDIKDISDEVIQQVLGLLTPEELASLDSPSPESNKQIFRRLAKELHPDVTGRPMGNVETAALRIFGRAEASNAKTFDRLKQVKQTTQASAQATTGRPKTAEEIRAEAAAQRAKEWQEGEARNRENRERVQREAKAREDARAAKAQADAAEANRARVGREQAEAAKKARTGQAAEPQTPPQPPPSIQDEVSSAATAGGEQNAAQRFGRKAIDTTKKVVGEFAQGVRGEASAIAGDIAQGAVGLGGGKAPTSGLGKVLPFSSPIDLGLRTGIDVYQMSKDPQWVYKAPTYWDAIKNELTNIGVSTGIGAGIGGLVGGPVGAGAGAVVGAAEGAATSLYGIAQAPMKMGYAERENLNNLKSTLDTVKTLQQNNPEYDYKEIISNLENTVSQMEKGESFESKLSKGVDATVRGLGLSSSDAEVAARETRTPEQLRADAEAAFEKRYPQGIRGGLAPGKSAAEVEKEAATDIINRLNAGAKPQDLAKELGWETDEQEKARQERAAKETELMASSPEKYGKMTATELSAAAAAKAVTDRAARVADQLKASRDAEQKKREEEDRIKDQEAAERSKNLEAMGKKLKEMPSLEQQTQMAKEKLRKAMEKSKASSV